MMRIIKIKDTEYYKGSNDDDQSFMIMIEDEKAEELFDRLIDIVENDDIEDKYDAMIGAMIDLGGKLVMADYVVSW